MNKHLTIDVTGPSSYIVYYSQSQLTSSNYSSGDYNYLSVGPDAGTYTGYYYVKSNDANYNDTSGSFTITINKCQILLRSASDVKEYDTTKLINDGVDLVEGELPEGQVLLFGNTLDYDNTNLAENVLLVCIVYGSQTEVGSSPNFITFFPGPAYDDINYDITTQTGTLTVEPVSIDYYCSIEEIEDVVYNGTEQKQPVTVISAFTDEPLIEGIDYIVTYSDDTVNVGTVTVTVEGIGTFCGTATTTYDIKPRNIEL